MADWSAEAYLQFDAERTRPAADLLMRVPLADASRVVDLGCGPGNSTELLTGRWPAAIIEGIDSSPAMLDAARPRLPQVRFREGDIARWRPEGSESLLFANAALQWVPGHLQVLEALLSRLSAGGVLAVQMPDNLGEPSHQLMRQVGADPRWGGKLADAEAGREAIADAGAYCDRLRPLAGHLDVWRTTYFHELDGAAAIVAWLQATGLRPYLARLDPDERPPFLDRFQQALADAYPEQANGRVLLPFPRLFIVATRA